MKWDIDKALASMEPESCPGTSITRVYMDLTALRKYEIRLTKAMIANRGGNVWCIGLGRSYQAKAFFYGSTIRRAFLRAQRAFKEGHLSMHTPWGGEHDWAKSGAQA